MDTAGHSNCYSDAVIQGSPNSRAGLKELESQIHKARNLVHPSELKVEAIVASIHEMEKFYPKIKIIRPPAESGEGGFSLFACNVLVKAG